MDYKALLELAHSRANAFLESLPERPVAPAPAEAFAPDFAPLPEAPSDPVRALDEFVAKVDPGLVASAGPRYFGFVTGGSYPVAVAADWLVSAWDQNTALHVMSPAMAAVEACTARWLLDALRLPSESSASDS